MGRSSNSSHYQLSTSKLISRVHVRAVYIPAAGSASRKVQIECTGWNGVKVHCQGKAWDLMKGDTFTSETEDADIMIDVQDARVLVTWPRLEQKALTPTDSDGTWDSENSPSRRATASLRNRVVQTSPLRQQHRLQSPVSPSPAVQATHAAPSGHIASDPPIPVPVQVYEDEPSDEDKEKSFTQLTQATTQIASQPLHGGMKDSQATEPASFSDNDEENDPIITSFGPFGANLDARMQTFTTSISPEVRRPLLPLKEENISPQRPSPPKRRRIIKGENIAESTAEEDTNKSITNFAINHLMYSPLSATPLSTLMQSMPSHLQPGKQDSDPESAFSSSTLNFLLESTPCIGAVEREGKDAAGKRLESEYYYIPEHDEDEGRRAAVQGLGIGARGLRNCRKSHKVCALTPVG